MNDNLVVAFFALFLGLLGALLLVVIVLAVEWVHRWHAARKGDKRFTEEMAVRLAEFVARQ